MPIKIVFVTTDLATGGAQVMLLKLLQYLDRQRFNPLVISLKTTGEIGPRIEALGIQVLSLGINPRLPNPRRILALFWHLRKIKPDLVQTWMYHADLLGGMSALLAGCKSIVWGVRNSNLDPRSVKLSTLLVVKICAVFSAWLPSRILSCSTDARKSHIAVGYCADKFYVIPNGFDLMSFQPSDRARLELRAELQLSVGTPLVGLVARYDSQKNHLGFIQAATIVHKKAPMVHFVLAGSGVDNNNPTLVAAIQEAGLAPVMHLMGRRDNVPRLMAGLDVLASSSFGEAFPNVLGEAMACGVPCVVTDVGDSAEIVGESGRIVRSGDMSGLAEQIVELLCLSPEAKSTLRRRARARVETNYEISCITDCFESFYEELIHIDMKVNA